MKHSLFIRPQNIIFRLVLLSVHAAVLQVLRAVVPAALKRILRRKGRRIAKRRSGWTPSTNARSTPIVSMTTCGTMTKGR